MNFAGYIPTIAKAVAAFVTPFVVAALAWLVEQTGVNVPHDPKLIETTLVAAVTAVATWAIRNRPTAPQGD